MEKILVGPSAGPDPGALFPHEYSIVVRIEAQVRLSDGTTDAGDVDRPGPGGPR